MKAVAEQPRTAEEWEKTIGARVRATMASAEMERYFSIKMTANSARIALLQLSLFVQCRRDCWANLIANCDALQHRRQMQTSARLIAQPESIIFYFLCSVSA